VRHLSPGEPAAPPTIAPADRPAWTPVRLFLTSRIAIWAAAIFVLLVLVPNQDPQAVAHDDPHITHDSGMLADVWARWDSYSFVHIAHHGYDRSAAAAFYPLYPWLLGAVGRATGGHYVIAGVLIALAAGAAAFALLQQLVERICGSTVVARRTLLLLAVFPTSLFLQAVYAESLFLFFAVAAFLLIEQEKLWWAAAATGLAMLTRPTGFALLLALVVSAARSKRRRDWLAPVGSTVIFLAYPLLLWNQLGSPTAFLHAEAAWERSLSLLGPLDGINRGLRAAWAGVLQLTVGSGTHWYWTPVNPERAAAINLEGLAYLVFFLVLAVIAWRKLGPTYGVFAVVGLAEPLSLPARAYPLLSLSRLGLVLFPVFIALASTRFGARYERQLVAGFAIFLGLNVVRWVLWQWVA
jgi:hypothetical protein